jgi:transposase
MDLSSLISVNNPVLLYAKETQGSLVDLGAVKTLAERDWNNTIYGLKRRVGRPRNPSLRRGGSSQNHEDELILTVLLTNGPLTAEEIIRHASVSKSTVYCWLNRFVKLGMVNVAGWPHKFAVTDDKGKILAYDLYRSLQTCVISISNQVKTEFVLKISEQNRWKKELDFIKEESKNKTKPYLTRRSWLKRMKAS